MKKHIPNMLTCCNLLCGAAAVYLTTQQAYTWAFILIIIAAVFDFFDGFVARLLHVSSPIGKELDSLADNITFGLTPSMMLMCLLLHHTTLGYWSMLAFLMAAFSALRLAKFNLDTRQSDSFIGLATPANAVFWASLVTCLNTFVPQIPLWAGWMLLAGSWFSCWLLMAEIPFFALKFHNFSWKDNQVRYIFLIGSLFIILLCTIGACLSRTHQPIIALASGAGVVIWYLIIGLISSRQLRKNATH
ncbi:MAG: CDP-diacylglycerol--serine O-phosphatidyltransferase [Paludibacter sp.]|nr:CDP-diacylglycerol--serine O-phosphatidyltransferase [Bacteroidales bacterium]MCM1069995.1 CDP-diacylglycerol--serine O-phosphatidyltransferase [Prevotella sp.]MCM1354540.1 CDP-diacylglycerol--serine O-phosphatidyltransferase [Bacteroides sp.]MCM1443623.1 CDP-diacylglycerol--serine O-phosphatidyltransferase [Muribaculum sp.]MCM1482688.1 CDP-diacylglycerol--serine O-phosphatidyltransferase [Paludibacter sp.]